MTTRSETIGYIGGLSAPASLRHKRIPSRKGNRELTIEPPREDRVVSFKPTKAGFSLDDKGCITKITEEGQAYWAGLEVGQSILKVNGVVVEPVTVKLDLKKAVKEAKKNNKKYSVTFTLPEKKEDEKD